MSDGTPPAPGSLAQLLANDFRGIRRECGAVRDLATGVGRLHPALVPEMTEMISHLIALASYVTGMETSVSAKKAVGELEHTPRQVPHAELELVALSADTRQRMAASLHRVGDHSLDSEEGKA